MDLTDLTIKSQKEIERQFAAIAHLYPVYTIQQAGWLKPADMITEDVRQFWGALLDEVDLTMDDEAASVAAMNAALRSNIVGELAHWAQELPNTPMPQAYANEIARRRYLVNVSASMGDLFKAIQAQDDLKLHEILSGLHNYHPGGVVELPDALTIAKRFNEIIQRGNRSIYTYIPPVDTATGGLEKQTLTMLAARTSMGKTALALQIARNIAMSGAKVIFFSLEMSAVSLWSRVAAPGEWRDFLAGRMSAVRQNDIMQLSESMAGQLEHLHIVETRQTSESIWRTVASTEPDVIIVDHLRYVKDQGENENKRQGKISEALHDLAKAFDIPVLCLVQINRGVEKQSEKRPQLSDLRDSGELEENADNVWMIYRDSYYSTTGLVPTNDITELWVKKFRNGLANIKIELRYNPKQQWFDPK